MKKKPPIHAIENTLAFRLACVLKEMVIPIKVAGDWIAPEDLPEFEAEIEQRIRALQTFVEGYFSSQKPRGIRVLHYMTGSDIANARKGLDSLSRTGKRGHSKRNSQIVREELSKALLGTGSTDFSAEMEELRRLRTGELRIGKPRAPKLVEP